jgi:hypothetical protein
MPAELPSPLLIARENKHVPLQPVHRQQAAAAVAQDSRHRNNGLVMIGYAVGGFIKLAITR